MKLTTSNPHSPRMLQAYSTLWTGPRPAVVVQNVDAGHANVNVLLDGTADTEALAAVRQSPNGNTAARVPVYEVEQPGEVPNPEQQGVETPQLGKVLCVWPVPPLRAVSEPVIVNVLPNEVRTLEVPAAAAIAAAAGAAPTEQPPAKVVVPLPTEDGTTDGFR